MFLYDGMAKDITTAKSIGESGGQGKADSADLDLEALLQVVGQTQNRQAFIDLFNYFAPRVKSFLMKRGASPEVADELAQETMLTLWDKAANFDPAKAKASTWVYTIARNKHIDLMRRNIPQYTQDTELLQLESDAPSPNENLQQAQETAAIEKALETLPEDQAALLHKSFFEGKSHGEIAKETNIPLGTVKSRIRMALEKLRGQESVKALR